MIGWIQWTVFHDSKGVFDFEWTDKGKELAEQFNSIVTEFKGGQNDLMMLAVICRLYATK